MRKFITIIVLVAVSLNAISQDTPLDYIDKGGRLIIDFLKVKKKTNKPNVDTVNTNCIEAFCIDNTYKSAMTVTLTNVNDSTVKVTLVIQPGSTECSYSVAGGIYNYKATNEGKAIKQGEIKIEKCKPKSR